MALLDFLRTRPPTDISGSIAKASSGVGAFWMTYEQPVSSISRNPQKMMREAQAIAVSNRWIRAAERVISSRFATVEWHLEDQNDEELPETDPIVHLFEKPYTPAPGDPLNSTPRTRTALWGLTSRHMGVCGIAYWYLDQAEALAGTPLQLLYINPARLTPDFDDNGNLVRWGLDVDGMGHGVWLERGKVLSFPLEQADSGFIPAGLVESAMSMVTLGRVSDRHGIDTFASGGRLAGVFAPAAAAGAMPQDLFDQLKRDLRTVADAPDAAKRALVLQGPIEFTRTSATPEELDLIAVGQMARDDTLALWGVPLSQLGGSIGGGLNSGETKKYDEATLWQNAVGPRLRNFRETLQFELLDRYQVAGRTIELEIEEPSFDDEAPMYALASQSTNLPLTRNERRAQVGMDPLPDWNPDGTPNGVAIDLPLNLQVIGEGESETARPMPPPPLPTPPVVENPFPVKAGLSRVSVKWTPKMQAAVSKVLSEQRTEVASRVRAQADKASWRPKDTSSWWSQKKWDTRLAQALAPFAQDIGNDVETKVKQKLGPAKAELPSGVLKRLLSNIAKRVVGINETTRDSIALLISNNIGKGGAELGDLIEQHTAFDENRAEMVARTETGTYLSQAAIASYDEFGVTHVEVIDGDEDDVCAQANGSTWTLEEADADPLGHPNCTRDFVPVLS